MTNQARKRRKRKRVEKAENVSQRISQTAPFEKGVTIGMEKLKKAANGSSTQTH